MRPGQVEQAPEDWWAGVVSAVRELGEVAGFESLAGIAVSSQAPTLIALDSQSKVIRPAMIWMDRRATPQAERFEAEYSADGYVEARGNRADAFYLAPKIAWLRDEEPDTLARTASFVQINGYIAARLTGVLSLDEQHASLLALRAAGASEWDETALNEIGITASQLPNVYPATAVIGGVTADAASTTGLPVGVPVVAGTVDSAAAAIETGVYSEGSAAEMAGTSSVLVMPSALPAPHPAFITMSSPDGVSWHHLAAVVASGASLRWLRGLTAPCESYPTFIARAEQVPAGAEGVLFVPHMLGERSPLWDTDRRGLFAGLILGTGIEHLVRAVLEGTAYSLRHNLSIAAALGVEPTELRSTGAPAESDLWCQVKADITGIPVVRMLSSTGAAFGAAVIAAVGVGAVATIAEFGAGIDRVGRRFDPTDDPALIATYDEGFASYLRAIDGAQTIFPRTDSR
jgi:xylulokinase